MVERSRNPEIQAADLLARARQQVLKEAEEELKEARRGERFARTGEVARATKFKAAVEEIIARDISENPPKRTHDLSGITTTRTLTGIKFELVHIEHTAVDKTSTFTLKKDGADKSPKEAEQEWYKFSDPLMRIAVAKNKLELIEKARKAREEAKAKILSKLGKPAEVIRRGLGRKP